MKQEHNHSINSDNTTNHHLYYKMQDNNNYNNNNNHDDDDDDDDDDGGGCGGNYDSKRSSRGSRSRRKSQMSERISQDRISQIQAIIIADEEEPEQGGLRSAAGKHQNTNKIVGNVHNDDDSDDGEGVAHWKVEWRKLLSVAGPMTITLLCRFVQGLTDLAVLGQVGTTQLAGASMALTIQFTTMGFITMGFGDAVPALCSQAYGAKQHKLMAVWTLLGMLTCSLSCIPIMAIWWWTEDILLLFRVSKDISHYAGVFSQWSVARMWPHTMYYCFKMFLSAQHILMPDLVVNIVFVIVNLAVNLVLVHGTPAWLGGWHGMGFKGSPLANVIARWLLLLSIVLYCRYNATIWDQICKSRTKQGWSPLIRAALDKKRVRTFMSIALPTALRSIIDLTQVQCLAFFASHLGDTQVATHNTLTQLYAVVGAAPGFGNADATCVRSGYHLGKGQPKGALLVAKLSVLNASITSTFALIVFLALRNYLGHLFSSDSAVLDLAADLSPWVGLLVMFECLALAFMGSLMGQGRMKYSGYAWLLGSAMIIPLSYWLAFPLDYGVSGLWQAWNIGYGSIAAVNCYLVLKSDWQQLAEVAVERSNKAALVNEADDINNPNHHDQLDNLDNGLIDNDPYLLDLDDSDFLDTDDQDRYSYLPGGDALN